MRISKISLSSSSLPTLAAALMVAGLAPAQAVAQDSVLDETPAPEEETRAIVVTGSRIATDAATALASPVQVVTIEQFKKAGEIDITQSLREIPALQGSDPANLDSAQGFGISGASTLDLRSLGANRTLVLQDGRRHVPGIAGTANVDVGSIPQALIREVQVLTGGASGVYGADAVSGVVNFITRTGRDFDGLEFRAQTGISDKGDSEEFFGSLAAGGTFDDGRGSAVFAVEYSRSKGILNGDRRFASGPGSAAFGQSNDFLNEQLGLAPGTENAFIPNRTLPVSSTSGIIAVGGFPFDRLAFGPRVATNFLPGTSTVPNFAGTDIPILQIIDPVTGELRAYNPGISTSAFNASGGDGIPINPPGLTLIPDFRRFVAAAAADYQITDTITAFADAKLAYVETSDTVGIPFADDLFLAGDNPFLPQQVQSQLAQLNRSFVGVALDNLASDTGRGNDIERSTIRASGGLRWDAPNSNVNFEASYTYGRTQVDSTLRRRRLNDRYFTAFDAVALTQDNIDGVDPIFNFTTGSGTLKAVRNGQDIEITAGNAQVGDIVCRSEVTGLPAQSNAPFLVGGPPIYNESGTNPVIINGTDVSGLTRPVTFQIGDGTCAPLNLLGDFSSQAAALNFAFVDLKQDTTIEQQQFLAVLAGDTAHLFELPGGPIGFAAGFEWRSDKSQFTRDGLETIEGRVIENVAAPLFNSPANGEGITVWELFGEIRVPLLGDMPFVHNLEVTAAGRYSDYNTIGKTETYSFGGIYAPTDWLTFRGTYSRAIRAPNIGELFAPQSIATIGVDEDPCDDGNITLGTSNRAANCAQFVVPGFDSQDFLTAFSTGTTGGNPLLREETSDSFTIGGVFQPKSGPLRNLVVIVDYYDIEITDAVGSLTGAAIAAACVDLPSTNNQFCDAIERDPNRGGAIVGFTSGNINLAVLKARGIDFETRYSFDVPFGGGDLGTIQLGAAGTRFLERFTEGDPVIGQTIADEPDPLQQQLLITDQAINSDLLGVIGLPKWIVNFNIDWNVGKLNLGWRTRWEDSTLQVSNNAATDVDIVDGAVVVSPNAGVLDASQLYTGDGFEHDLSFSYKITEKAQFFGGVNNLTDREPFLGSLARPVGPRGRFFFLGVSGSF